MITVDLTSSRPPFEQVREQIRDQVESGELVPGTRLPTVRALADQVGVATGTVARAYRELEGLGLIETRGRAGSVVSGGGVQTEARQAAHNYARRMKELGIGEAEAVALLRRALG